jgi:hypothetical protein
LKGSEMNHFPPCSSCRTLMERIRIYQKSGPTQELLICPQCHEPEIVWAFPDGRKIALERPIRAGVL